MSDRKEKLKQIAESFDLEIIYAFGSHSKDAAKWIDGNLSRMDVKRLSDLDIGVKAGPGLAFGAKEKAGMEIAFEKLFSLNRVDLVVIQEADPFLAVNIIRGERLFSRDDYEADEYDLYLLRRAGDLIPLEQERIALIMEEEE